MNSGVLIGNKIDLGERRVVTEKEGISYCDKNKLQYFECSAVGK